MKAKLLYRLGFASDETQPMAILTGPGDDGSGERLFVEPLQRLVALCPSPLP
jgi:hypothetical protein